MNARCEMPGERNGGLPMPPGPQQQVHFDEHGPGNHGITADTSEKLGCENMPTTLALIYRGGERPRIADDQSASRARISFTF